MPHAPIVLFTYNRPYHTKRTLESLALNVLAKESVLYIYCDGEKSISTQEEKEKIKQVRQVVKEQNWCKKVYIFESENNKGLAQSIIQGVSEVVKKHGKVIVLEDDLLLSEHFLSYMNGALNHYENEKRVWHISGWNYPISNKRIGDAFFIRVMNCWGWATWKDRWEHFEKDADKLIEEFTPKMIKSFNLDNTINFWKQVELNKSGKIDTWAIFWYATIFKNHGLCLNPTISFVENIGLDGSGVHCGNHENIKETILNNKNNIQFPDEIVENRLALTRIKRWAKRNKKPLFLRVVYKLVKLLLAKN